MTLEQAITDLQNNEFLSDSLILRYLKELRELRESDLTSLAKKVHENAVNHGWWEEERSIGDIIALCHSELSEALEEHRNGHAPRDIYYTGEKPEGIPTELADVVIRIMDYCGKEGIDLKAAIIEKIKYNETRPYRHGGKKL